MPMRASRKSGEEACCCSPQAGQRLYSEVVGDNKPRYDWLRLDAPVANDMALRMVDCWQTVFDAPLSWLLNVMLGAEHEHNEDTIFVACQGADIAATCRLTISHCDQRIGLLGEVATVPEHRGNGLAKHLCRWALEDFGARHGQALFLGTNNAVAARLYAELGWRQLAGSQIMLNQQTPSLPEEYLADYYRSGKSMVVTIRPGGARYRAPMVPLIVTPLDFRILDANTVVHSTRYVVQASCEGLYGKYEGLGDGTWFVAEREDGAVVGLASAKHVGDGVYCAEAFAHPYHQECCLKLMYEAAISWCHEQECNSVYTTCSRFDPVKEAAVREMG
jgi:GNAT superfamily N-acetyltransferase